MSPKTTLGCLTSSFPLLSPPPRTTLGTIRGTHDYPGQPYLKEFSKNLYIVNDTLLLGTLSFGV